MIQQWVYSYSCWKRKKRETDMATRGFGTFSWSDGLTLAEVEELERRCPGYELPDWASSRPGEEEKQRFPLAFYSFRLASGKRVVVRTQYVGECFFDKRWGATISHGMILPQGDWPGYPAEWMDSPDFWKELPENVRMAALSYKDDANRPDPDPLPILSESEFRPSGNFSVERVLSHFENEEARGLLVRLLTLWSRSNRRPACAFFHCPDDEAPWLMAGFSMLFPAAWSQDISFSTRLLSPRPSETDDSRWYEVAVVDIRKTKVSLENCPSDLDAESLVSAFLSDRNGFFEFLQGFSETTLADWRILLLLYRLVCGPVLSGTSERLTEGLHFLRAHGDGKVRTLCLKGVLENKSVLPATLTAKWIEALVSLCDGDPSAEAVVMRLFLSYRQRFSTSEALDCFLSFNRQNLGEVGRVWLDDFAADDRSTLGVSFTIAAASTCMAEGQTVVQRTKEALAGAETAQDLDWSTVLSFAAMQFPSSLPAVFSTCPDDQAVRIFCAKALSKHSDAVPVIRQLLDSGEDEQARRVLFAVLDARKKNGVGAFVQLFDALSSSVEPFAKNVFMEAFLHATRQGNPFAPTGDEWIWLADKLNAEVIPKADRDDYWAAIDAMLPSDAKSIKRIRPALNSFLQSAPPESKQTRSGFLRWAEEILENKGSSFEFSALEEFAPVYSGLDSDTRRSWLPRLLPVLYPKIANDAKDDAPPDSVEQHQKLIHFLADGLDEQDRNHVAVSYATQAVEDARRQRDGMRSARFGGLLRLILRPDTDAPLRLTIRQFLLRTVYWKYSKKELEKVIDMPALTNRSSDEEEGLDAFYQSFADLKKRRGVIRRIWAFFTGKKQP